MARAENDDATLLSASADIEKLEKDVAALEFRRMFSNPLDPNNCFIDIQAGAGGTEAQDWASMLERMYLKYCDKKGFRAEVLEQTDGEVAGIKSATLKITGDYAYGSLRTENGVHRLVRKSPFDSNARRHTSFASVFVYPEVDESIEVEINPADLRVDVYRASGAGGQHVNKTESAVRITHLPTDIVVQSQNDRSQHRNRAECMAMLKSRLYELELRKRNAEADKLEAAKTDIEWGHQIRSYVLDQSRIKDLRTGVEKGATQTVLDGDLDDFITRQPEAGSLEDGRRRQQADRGAAREAEGAARRGRRLSRTISGRKHLAADLHAATASKTKEELEKAAQPRPTVAGRMMLKRVMGKASFATLQDGSGRIQVYVTAGRRRATRTSSTGTSATSSASRATSSRRMKGELTVHATKIAPARQGAAAAAGEVPRPRRPRDALPPALRRPDRQPAGAATCSRSAPRSSRRCARR